MGFKSEPKGDEQGEQEMETKDEKSSYVFTNSTF
jgi:hypothetical protein